MNTNVFLLLFSLVFSLSSTWERERVYNWYREKQSQSLLILFRWIPVENISSFTGQQTLLFFSTGLKIWLLVRATFRLPLPGALALGSLAATSVQQLTFFLPTSADGRSFHFRPRVPANHLASLFFSLVRRFVRAIICHPVSHSLSIRSPSTNICFSILTWICYFGIDPHYLS